jgi:hypothetical protein
MPVTSAKRIERVERRESKGKARIVVAIAAQRASMMAIRLDTLASPFRIKGVARAPLCRTAREAIADAYHGLYTIAARAKLLA